MGTWAQLTSYYGGCRIHNENSMWTCFKKQCRGSAEVGSSMDELMHSFDGVRMAVEKASAITNGSFKDVCSIDTNK